VAPVAEAKVQTYHFGPRQKSSAIGGMSWFQVMALGLCGTVAVGLTRTMPIAIGMAAGVALLAAGFAVGFVRFGGRLVEEWFFPLRYWLGRRGRRGRHWVGGDDDSGPPGLEHLKFFAVRLAQGEVGVVFDQVNGTYLGVMSCAGSAFLLVDRAEQDRLLRAWGEVLNGWCVDDESIHRLQLLERTLPEDGDAMARYLERAAAVPAGAASRVSYARLLDRAQPLSQRHETFVVVAVSQNSPAVRRAGGGDVGACEMLAQEMVSLRERARQAEVVVDRVLGPEEVVRCLRVGFEPELGLRPGAWSLDESRSPRLGDAWPRQVRTTWSHYETDGLCHASFWVAEWPRIGVGADFLCPMFLHTRGTRTISIVMEPMAPAQAAREVLDARTAFMADQRIRDSKGYVPTAFRDAEGASLAQREADLAAGHGEFRFSAYVTVSAPSVEALETTATSAIRLANRCQLRLWRLYGQQDLGFACGLPLARGLR
jgi:hypothetical protein